MNARLDIYETMSKLSGLMVEAAQSNDWDRLSGLEHQVAALRDRLVTQDSVSALPLSDESVRARKIALIRKMLADDREIRRHTEPWMDAVRLLLAGASKQRAVKAAYGVQHGL